MLTANEINEIDMSDDDFLETRTVRHACGHVFAYEETSACQKAFLEKYDCPDCRYAREKANVEKLAAEYGPKVLDEWKRTSPVYMTSGTKIN